MANNELKPCPFCGGKAYMWRQYGKYGWCVFVKCSTCNSQGKTVGFGRHYTLPENESEFWDEQPCKLAADNWNRRVTLAEETNNGK